VKDNIFAFSATETGYNHIKIDKVCEDASGVYNDEMMHICVVADGHGSDNYPRTERGSKMAVDAAIKCTVEFVKVARAEEVISDEKNNYSLLLQLAKSILKTWYQSIEEDYQENPFVESELEKVSEKYKRRYLAENEADRKIEKAYGCTLIIFAVTDRYSFGMQIGDGKCVVVDSEGEFSEPIPWDENCQLNVTTSLCDSDAIDEFRFYVTENKITAVFCGSDGIDDSYVNTQELYALYRSILTIFDEHGKAVGENEIKEYLPILTRKGSGDDVSIGVIIDMVQTQKVAAVLKMQSEIFNLLEEEKTTKRSIEKKQEKKNSLINKLQKSIADKKIENVEDDAIMQIKQLDVDCNELSCRLDEIKKRIKELEESCKDSTVELSATDIDFEAQIKTIQADGDNSVDISLESMDNKESSLQNRDTTTEDICVYEQQDEKISNESVKDNNNDENDESDKNDDNFESSDIQSTKEA
jgi:hypothetical protein